MHFKTVFILMKYLRKITYLSDSDNIFESEYRAISDLPHLMSYNLTQLVDYTLYTDRCEITTYSTQSLCTCLSDRRHYLRTVNYTQKQSQSSLEITYGLLFFIDIYLCRIQNNYLNTLNAKTINFHWLESFLLLAGMNELTLSQVANLNSFYRCPK